MILELNDARYAAGIFIDFFEDLNRIDQYLRKVKMERIQSLPSTLPEMGPENDLFDDFSMHPNDMDFTIRNLDHSSFGAYLEITSSHCNEMSIPGKAVLLGVYEKNTSKLIGMIRLGSPTINSRPRNIFLGKPLDTKDPGVMKRFNDSSIMGFVIVPTQPFGFNYLGGKLLAAICCSHHIRRLVNEKYNSNICMFETTSLYGSTSAASQYDGMKPFLRYAGLTDSNFAPSINDETYRTLYRWFVEKNEGEHLVHDDASSKKMKRMSRMISIIRNSLKDGDPDLYNKFCRVMESAKGINEQKRTYFCSYGYENVSDYLNLKTETLIEKDNFDRYELENVIQWWRKKASKRFETLKREGRVRMKLETWNTNADEIDIIR